MVSEYFLHFHTKTIHHSHSSASSKFEFFVVCFHCSADWYKDRLTDKQLDELENPPTTTTETARVKKVSSRRKHPKLQPATNADE